MNNNIVLSLLLIVGFSFLLSYPWMLLWNNCLVGAVNGVNSIGWFQSWGIMILIRMLFNSYSSNKKETL